MEVKQGLKNLHFKKAAPIRSILSNILKDSYMLVKPFSHAMNNSFQSCTFSKDLSMGNLTAFFKKGDPPGEKGSKPINETICLVLQNFHYCTKSRNIL